jgi:hypothetical protein
LALALTRRRRAEDEEEGEEDCGERRHCARETGRLLPVCCWLPGWVFSRRGKERV